MSQHLDTDKNLDEPDLVADGSAFPKKRQDQLEQFARDFMPVAHAASNGRMDGLDSWRTNSKFVIHGRMDAGAESIYLARQLELIVKGAYETKYGPIKSPRLISYNTGTPRGVVNLTKKAIDSAGEPMIERDDSDQLPMIGLKMSPVTMGFFNMQLGYDFTDQEVAQAMYAGEPLQAMKATATRRAFERKLDIIAFYGEKVSGVKGMLNLASTTSYSTPVTGAGGTSKKWTDKASDDILLDLNAAGDAIIVGTDEVEEPDTWLIPLDAYNIANTRRIGDGTSEMVLSFFKRTRDLATGQAPIVERTVKSQGANNANWSGSGSESRMMVYKNDADHLEMYVPVPFFQRAPEYRNARTIVSCMMRTGGVACWLPKAVAYADGVS